MLIPLSDLGSRSVLIFGRYLHEEAETRLLRRRLRGCRRVVDVGASIGWYSVLAHSASPTAEIHAFEANPEVLPYLRANAIGRGIRVHATAVADRSGTLDFFCASSSNLSSASRNVGTRITVPSVALDDLALPPVDFVKVDVEGGEIGVLRGARRLRAKSPHAIWMIEADEQMLREAGTTLEELDDELALPDSVWLYTVDPSGAWRQINSIIDMRGALHKNVLISPAPLAGEGRGAGF